MKPTSFRDLQDRYYNDATFHSLVDMMYAHMVSSQIAPYEMRDAAYFASIKFAHLNLEPRAIQRRFPDEDREILEMTGAGQ